jgi:hypothetical protein
MMYDILSLIKSSCREVLPREDSRPKHNQNVANITALREENNALPPMIGSRRETCAMTMKDAG